jgi:predicted MFS family arabinose efflux permease
MVSTGRALHEERRLLWLLAALQFTHIFDLMMISPLGPQFMRLWQLSAGEFGVLVAVYAVAAALAGVAASFVIDRFDRRSVLLLAYAGFTLSTLACALAPGYASFLVARGLAGIFGGVIGSIVMALVGDLIPVERRGRAMGLVMSAFPLVRWRASRSGSGWARTGAGRCRFLCSPPRRSVCGAQSWRSCHA